MKKTLKKVLKISISVVLSVAIFFTIAITETVADSEVPAPKYTYEANIGKKWYFGNERITSFTSQGENGFYAMYSTAVNQGKNFPVEDAKLCEYDSSDDYWKISDGLGGYRENFKIASSQSGYGVNNAFTKAVHLATGYSAIIKWVAPKGGEYFVEQWWRGDEGGIFTANNDGVIVSVYKGSKILFYHDQIDMIKATTTKIESFEKTKDDGLVTLNAGEALYFVFDPKAIGYTNSWTKDSPWTQITIEYRGNAKKSTSSAAALYSSTKIGTTYSFGKNGTEFTGEGGGGFYAMYSMAINKGNQFPVNSFYYAKPITNDEKHFGIPLWNDNAYVDKFRIGSSALLTANKATVNLDNGYTAAIKWVAPESGEYTVDAQWRYDGYGVFAKTEDGLDLSIYRNEENIYYKSISQTEAWSEDLPIFNNNGKTLPLNKGDALYFIADPKTVAYTDKWTYDAPWLNVDITLVSPLSEDLNGDINVDGEFDIRDLVSLKKLFAANTASQNENADVNMDGLHNSLDLIKMRCFLLDVDKRYPISAKEYIFGDDAFNSMKKQGSGNFYAMYLDSSNHGASFPVQNLKQMNYVSRIPRQWMPDDGETTYMYLRSSGETALQANKSLAVKWVAPETGTYYIDSFFYGGTRDVSTANDDGIAFGVYKNTERLAYINKTSAFWIEKEDIQKDLSQHVIKTVEMNKGDALYFTADPKGVIKSADLPKIYIKISNSEEEGFNYSLGMSDFSGTNPDDVIAYSAPEQYPQYHVQYIVKINGKDVGVFSDKNSWEKSVNFATFEMRENSTVKVEVTPLFTYRKYKILPDKYGIESNRSGNTIKFDLSDPKAKLSFVFEDNYKNTTLHLFANPIDDNAPTTSSENIIYFGPGYHLLSETIKPKHNQTVYIANGAVVNGSIYVEGMENVTICGSGILVRDEDSASGFRGIRLIECLGVKISGITVNINMSMEWTTEIRRCADVTITNYKVVSPEWASTDGIDIINSQRITVDDCFLRANDDTITLKGLEWDGVSTSTLKPGIKGIRVNNCILWNECNSAMVVGEETLAKYYSDIKFTDIDVLFSYDDIYYHEALYERAVISIISGHGCTFEDIHWENIRVNMCERLVCFAFIDEFYTIPVGEYCQALPGYMKNITVKNVTSNSTSDNIYANQLFLKGWNADKTISNITFDNVIIKGEKLTAGSPLIVKNEYVSEITVK